MRIVMGLVLACLIIGLAVVATEGRSDLVGVPAGLAIENGNASDLGVEVPGIRWHNYTSPAELFESKEIVEAYVYQEDGIESPHNLRCTCGGHILMPEFSRVSIGKILGV